MFQWRTENKTVVSFSLTPLLWGLKAILGYKKIPQNINSGRKLTVINCKDLLQRPGDREGVCPPLGSSVDLTIRFYWLPMKPDQNCRGRGAPKVSQRVLDIMTGHVYLPPMCFSIDQLPPWRSAVWSLQRCFCIWNPRGANPSHMTQICKCPTLPQQPHIMTTDTETRVGPETAFGGEHSMSLNDEIPQQRWEFWASLFPWPAMNPEQLVSVSSLLFLCL